MIAELVFGWSIPQLLIALIIIGGAIAVAQIVLQQMEIEIPAWVIKIIWIIFLVFVGVTAIHILMGM